MKLRYFAELGAGPLRLSKRHCDLAELVKQVIEELRPFVEEKELILSEPPETTGVEADLDAERLLEAISNLFLNAVASAPPKGRIGYELTSDERCSTISVWDTGEAPEWEPAETLADKDLFVEDIIQTKTIGIRQSSIRMAFVRHILDAHGGTVRLTRDSEQERNVVTLEIPTWKK